MSTLNHNSSDRKQLIQFIEIHFKDKLKIDHEDKLVECYDEPHLCIIYNSDLNKIYIPIHDTLEKNKKRIELEMKRHIKEKCTICNEIQKLLYCDECLNQYCYFCHAHIVIQNKGTPVCPFCRDGEDKIHLNSSYDNALKKHRYDFALKLIESKESKESKE
jgi:hypothetical protein